MCDQVAINHRIAKCGEMFCKACFDINYGKKCPACKKCELKYDKKILSWNMALNVLCPYKNNGCAESEALWNLLKHMKGCEYSPEKLLPKLYRGRSNEDTVEQLENDLNSQKSSLQSIKEQLKKCDHSSKGNNSMIVQLQSDVDDIKKKIEYIYVEVNRVKKDGEKVEEKITHIFEENLQAIQQKRIYLKRDLKQQQTIEVNKQLANTEAYCFMYNKQNEKCQSINDRIQTLNRKFQTTINDWIQATTETIKLQKQEEGKLLSEVKDEIPDALHKLLSKLIRLSETQYDRHETLIANMGAKMIQQKSEFTKKLLLIAPMTESQSKAQLQERLEDILTEFQETTLKQKIINEIKKLEKEFEDTAWNYVEEVQYLALAEIFEILSRHEISTLLEMETKLKSAVNEHIQNMSLECQETIESLMRTLHGNQLQDTLNKIESTVKSQGGRPTDTMVKEWLNEADARKREIVMNKHIKKFEKEMETLCDKFKNIEEAIQKTLQKEIERQFNEEDEEGVKVEPFAKKIPREKQDSAVDQPDVRLQTHMEELYACTTWTIKGIKQKLCNSQHQHKFILSKDILQLSQEFCCKIKARLYTEEECYQVLFSLKCQHDSSNVDKCFLDSLHTREYRLLDQSENLNKKNVVLFEQPFLRKNNTDLKCNENAKKTALIPIKVLQSDENCYVKDDCITIQINVKSIDLMYKAVAKNRGFIQWDIDNYKQRKQDEIDGIVKCLYSEPFYTSDRGCLVHAKLYLNGCGEKSRGKFLSIHVGFLVGEWDSENSGPLKFRLSVSIKNQDNALENGNRTSNSPTGQICKLCIRTCDVKSKIYEGFNEFCTHQQVESPAFIKKDTLTVEIQLKRY